MIIYFADRHLNILGQATSHLPQGVRLISDLTSQDVESGVSVFEADIGFDRKTRAKVEAWTEVGNYILLNSDGKGELYSIIDAVVDTKKQKVSVYAEDDGLDLLNDIAEAYEADQEYPISSYIERFAGGAGWGIGINEVEGLTRKLKWDSEQTVSARLISIAEGFNHCEMSFSFDIKGLQIEKKNINIYEKRGKDIGVQLRLNKEIDSIVTTKTISNLATALRARGIASNDIPDQQEEPVTLLNYEYDDGDFYVDGEVLKSRNALQRWSRFLWKGDESQQSGGHIVKSFSYSTTSQEVLCLKTIEKLKEIRDMEVNYEVDIKKLPSNVKIGDRVNIIDDAGELYLSTRILKLESSETNGEHKATLGEHLIKGSGISQKVADLAAQFAANAASAKKALEVANSAKESADAALEEANTAAETVQGAIDAATSATQAANSATESAGKATEAATKATEAVDKVEESVSGLQQTIENANEAAENAGKAAQTATEEAGKAQEAAENALKKAEEAKEANSEAQEKAAEAVEKANQATETAGTAKAKAQEAAAIATAAKKDALQAESDIAEWEQNLKTVTDTMSAEYSRKTDLTEATESLQSQISRNAGSIKQNVIGITVIDETANNALTTIEAAQNAATEAQKQADEASEIAAQAQAAANTAQAAATAAQNEANTAKTAYETAKQVADEAEAALKAAEADLATVAGRVDATEEEIAAAQQAVDEAQAAADTAKATAKSALATATAAQETANAAVDTATKAQINANKAANEAEIAQQLADEAAVNLVTVTGKVAEAQATANTAKANADNLKKAAETAQATADQAALSATEAEIKAEKAAEKSEKAAAELAAAQEALEEVLANVDATEEAVANAYEDVEIAQAAADEAEAYYNTAQAAANAAATEAAQAQAAADTAKAAADAAQAEAKAAQDAVDKALGIVNSLEKRITTNETGIEQTKSQIRLFATKDEVIRTLGGYYTKEEADSEIDIKADKITTKVKQSFETKENVREKLDGYYTKTESDAQLVVKADEITSTVSESYLTKEDFSQAQEELTKKVSEISQTAESLDIKFTEKTTETDKEMHSKITELYKRFSFTEKGLIIGGGENALSVTIDNEGGIVFAKNGEPFGWWDGTDFYTGNIVVRVNERAQFGDFAFVPRTSGNLSFLKVKGSNSSEYEHTCSYTTSVTKAATCTEAGIRANMCSCGKNFTEPIEPLGHNYVPVITPPTETAQGYTTYTCSRCGDKYVSDYIDATGCQHGTTAVRYETTKEPTCTAAGSRNKITYCTKCSAVISTVAETIAKTGHKDTDGNGYCDVCNTKVGDWYTITVQADPTNGGTVSGGGEYLSGSTATVTATPASGYSFDGWYYNDSKWSSNASYSFKVTSAKTFTAKFTKNTVYYTVNVTKDPTNGGTVKFDGVEKSSGTYAENSTVTLLAEAASGYEFDKWIVGAGTEIGMNPWSCYVNGNITATAKFKQKTVTEQTLANNATTTINVAASDVSGKDETNVFIEDFTLAKFVAPSSGTYIFESTAAAITANTGTGTTADPTARLYDSSKSTILGADDDGGSISRMFKIEKELTSGTTYYLAIKFYSVGMTGTVDVKVTKNATDVTEYMTAQISAVNGGYSSCHLSTNADGSGDAWESHNFEAGETVYYFAYADEGKIISKVQFNWDGNITENTAEELASAGYLSADYKTFSFPRTVGAIWLGTTYKVTVYFEEASSSGAKKTITFTNGNSNLKIEHNGTVLKTMTTAHTWYTYEFTTGDEVTLTSTPHSGYDFWRYSDGTNKITSSNPYSFTVSDDTPSEIWAELIS